METVSFVRGQMDEYIAQREFSLNFEDRKVTSVKVRKGETVLYDGQVASYEKGGGDVVTSRCPSLKSAIMSGWMVRKDGKTLVPAPAIVPRMASQNIVTNSADYDPKKGGNFDTYVGMDKDIHMARSGTSKRAVENYNDRIVKIHGGGASAEPAAPEESGVVGDQVQVKDIPVNKERSIVSNSTSVGRNSAKGAMRVVQANNAGAEHTIPMKGLPKKAAKEASTVKRTLIDGSVMTGPLPDGATLADIKKAYGGRPVVAVDGEAQEGVVVKKVGGKVDPVRSEEGVTFRKTMPRTKDARVVASVGEASMSMDGSEQKVVRKIGKTASAHPEAAEAEVAPAAPEMMKKEDGTPDYLSMLPANWTRMHWVQKEKFILQLNDADFIRYILQVETLAAVVNACQERLKQLAETATVNV